MSDTTLELLKIAVPSGVSLAGLVLVFLARRDINQVRVHINSRMDRLLKVTGESEHAKGKAEEKAEAEAREEGGA